MVVVRSRAEAAVTARLGRLGSGMASGGLRTWQWRVSVERGSGTYANRLSLQPVVVVGELGTGDQRRHSHELPVQRGGGGDTSGTWGAVGGRLGWW